nr:hypothetical protein [uncultured Roseateles sp.]
MNTSSSNPSSRPGQVATARRTQACPPSFDCLNASVRAAASKPAAALTNASRSVLTLMALALIGLSVALPSLALDLVAFTGITGPLTSALTQISALGPGIKALVGFVGFVVALISLSAMRNFSSVLFYVGLAIFAAVGLVIAGAIMGAVI